LYLLLLKSDKVNAKSFSAEYPGLKHFGMFFSYTIFECIFSFMVSSVLNLLLSFRLESWCCESLRSKLGFSGTSWLKIWTNSLTFPLNLFFPRPSLDFVFPDKPVPGAEWCFVSTEAPKAEFIGPSSTITWRFRYRETCVLKNLTRFYFTLNARVEEEVIILFVKLHSTTEWGNIKVMWSCWT